MYKCVAVEEVQSFVERCMKAVGTDPQHCTALSQVLTEADVRGHVTHGLNRLGECSPLSENHVILILINIKKTNCSSISKCYFSTE